METIPNLFVVIVSACISEGTMDDNTKATCHEFMARPQFLTRGRCEKTMLGALEAFSEAAIKKGLNFTIQDVVCREYRIGKKGK